MIGYIGQDGHSEIHPTSDVGKEDGMSEVSLTPTIVRCNKCGATYNDTESIELVQKWTKEGYAPCPNLCCPGQLEVTTPRNKQERGCVMIRILRDYCFKCLSYTWHVIRFDGREDCLACRAK